MAMPPQTSPGKRIWIFAGVKSFPNILRITPQNHRRCHGASFFSKPDTRAMTNLDRFAQRVWS